MVKNDTSKELQNLSENLKQAESDRDHFKSTSRNIDAAKVAAMEEVHDEYRLKIENLQNDIEQKDAQFEEELLEVNNKATHTVEQLKNVYEQERARLEGRANEEKERATKRLNN